MIHVLDSELEKVQSAKGSHPRDCDVFDITTRSTKIHQSKVRGVLFF